MRAGTGKMNKYTENINRIEFVITYACTGRCKHCSEGEHLTTGEHIDGNKAVEMIKKVCENFEIKTLMTFGGEPLLHIEDVCNIHRAATEMKIPKRQIITNGFFSKDEAKIRETAEKLAQSGVNEILLSVDAFHQETIPLEPVKAFAEAVKNEGIHLKLSPAWLLSERDKNPYNIKTNEILKEFEHLNIEIGEGNIIFPQGNARKYLKEYFDPDEVYVNPYEEDPQDIRTLSVDPNGDVLGGNIYRTDIMDIINNYKGE